ncbi:MAG: non-hydrolyzing UDP-N-acetylglucosamine 2-epimerase [Acidobacteriota bacterium]
MKKVLTVFGTRPEAIKMAPVVRALREANQLQTVVCVTAQHREMLDQVLELFKIVPEYDLDIMKNKQDLFDIAAGVLAGFKNVLQQEKPDLVLVHGDTSTTFIGALASYYLQIPVGHVEAGLRTRNKYSPFPEEMNRALTGQLADIHFAPTAWARDNLLAESVPAEKIFVTGNTVIDALLQTVGDDHRFAGSLAGLDFTQKMILVTTHRRESWGERMRQIYLALLDILEQFPDTFVVFPVHMNPIVRDLAYEVLNGHPRVSLIDPLEYADFANLMARSHLIITDSGGLQEEAPALGKPVLVLRETTERPEAVDAGTVKLVGTDRDTIRKTAGQLLAVPTEYEKMAHAANPYGDGRASLRIRDIIIECLGC